MTTTEKGLEYYMNLPYTVRTVRDDDGYFVEIVELPGCMSQGDTIEEAHEMIRDAMRGWLLVALEDGDEIPEPPITRKAARWWGDWVRKVHPDANVSLFEDELAEAIDEQYEATSIAFVFVDHWLACPILRDAAKAAGTHLGITVLPWQTTMEIKDGEVHVSLYGAPYERI